MYSIALKFFFDKIHLFSPIKSFFRCSTGKLIPKRTFSSIELKPDFDGRHHLNESTTKEFSNSNNNNNDELTEIFFEQFVAQEFSMNRDDVKKLYFLFTNSIKENYSNNESIIHLCKFLKLFFTAEDIKYNPRPFLIPFQQLYNRVLLLKEIGFRSFQISMIDSTPEILKLNLYQLKKYLNYPEEQDCFETICKILDIYGEAKLNLINYIKDSYGELDQIPIHDLRIFCTANFLSTRLNVSFIRAHHFCRKQSRLLDEINLLTMKTNIDFLKNNFNYSNNKIIYSNLFLLINPENLTLISTKLKPIIGDHLYENLIKTPQVLKLNFSQIVENYELIKQKCDGKFFTRSIELLSIEPNKLKTIFNEIETNEDIKRIKLDMLGLDFLAINRQKIFERIESLKRERIPLNSIPLSLFISNDSEFENMLHDLTNDLDLRVRFFLNTRFNLDYDAIKHRLYIVSNLKIEKYSNENANRVIEFLILMNVNKELIINFIYLIFFDYKQVKGAYFFLCNRMEKSLLKSEIFFQHLIEHLQATKSSTKILQNIK